MNSGKRGYSVAGRTTVFPEKMSEGGRLIFQFRPTHFRQRMAFALENNGWARIGSFAGKYARRN